ncbi:hypothetical protein [Polaribacter tangerinus]|uniref:hypothetical protein n=1 Tax=Polaribacter tangerinus TaxID=1920034 RepID=UPI000B4BDB9A|nr:hypothetical protein [Polaribacter tangerinus]
MHKKLQADLMSLAHSLLQMKNKEDVFALKLKAQEIYEKLSLLAFVEEYVTTTPNLEKTKETLLNEVSTALDKKQLHDANLQDSSDIILSETQVDNINIADKVEVPQNEYLEVENEKLDAEAGDDFLMEEPLLEEDKTALVNEYLEVGDEEAAEVEVTTEIEQPFQELENLMFEEKVEILSKEHTNEQPEKSTPTLEEELKDTISVDVMANLFETVDQVSLNDSFHKNIQIGLNDRIAFVKNLFDGSQEDFNRVISQLNSFKTLKEAKKFINKMVKPDYNWQNYEELETRFMDIVARKFL